MRKLISLVTLLTLFADACGAGQTWSVSEPDARTDPTAEVESATPTFDPAIAGRDTGWLDTLGAVFHPSRAELELRRLADNERQRRQIARYSLLASGGALAAAFIVPAAVVSGDTAIDRVRPAFLVTGIVSAAIWGGLALWLGGRRGRAENSYDRVRRMSVITAEEIAARDSAAAQALK